jgi:hypothetical protein
MQSVPVYLSEMAPAKLRGALNIGFQMAITIGILAANLINYGTSISREGVSQNRELRNMEMQAILERTMEAFREKTEEASDHLH